MMWQKTNETDYLFTKVFIFFSNINVIPFKIVPLGSYTPMETLFPLLVVALEVLNRYGPLNVRYIRKKHVFFIFLTEGKSSFFLNIKMSSKDVISGV